MKHKKATVICFGSQLKPRLEIRDGEIKKLPRNAHWMKCIEKDFADSFVEHTQRKVFDVTNSKQVSDAVRSWIPLIPPGKIKPMPKAIGKMLCDNNRVAARKRTKKIWSVINERFE